MCIFENCKTIPIFNFEGVKNGLYCSVHKLENMVDVKIKHVFMKIVKHDQFIISMEKPTRYIVFNIN